MTFALETETSLLNTSALMQAAERLVAAARKAGADSADAVAVRSMSLSAEIRDGKPEEVERSEGDNIGLRVLVGQRQAIVSTSEFGTSEALAARAVSMARAAPEDRTLGLADQALLATDFPDLDLLDPKLTSVDELEALARRAEAAAMAVHGVTKSGGASASVGIGGMVLVTSHGFARGYLGSSHSISMTAIATEGDAMERDYDYALAVHASDLASPEDIGRLAGERAVRRRKARKVETCKAPVVFDPRVSASLISHLAGAITGTAVARKTSFLKDRLGERIFSPGISIIDDPLRRRGLRSRSFDAEGVAARRLAIIEDGVLTSWFLDCGTARELGLRTTGHAQRGVSSGPSPGASNLHLEAGAQTPQALIGEIANGFYVTELIGMGVNSVTGDYSRGASGFWIENGELTYPVAEVTIAGNLIEMYRNLVPADDLHFRFGTNAPTVRVEGLTIAGL